MQVNDEWVGAEVRPQLELGQDPEAAGLSLYPFNEERAV